MAEEPFIFKNNRIIRDRILILMSKKDGHTIHVPTSDWNENEMHPQANTFVHGSPDIDETEPFRILGEEPVFGIEVQ